MEHLLLSITSSTFVALVSAWACLVRVICGFAFALRMVGTSISINQRSFAPRSLLPLDNVAFLAPLHIILYSALGNVKLLRENRVRSSLFLLANKLPALLNTGYSILH